MSEAERESYAQTGIDLELLNEDLETIANYIVHLKQEELHEIAVKLKNGHPPEIISHVGGKYNGIGAAGHMQSSDGTTRAIGGTYENADVSAANANGHQARINAEGGMLVGGERLPGQLPRVAGLVGGRGSLQYKNP